LLGVQDKIEARKKRLKNDLRDSGVKVPANNNIPAHNPPTEPKNTGVRWAEANHLVTNCRPKMTRLMSPALRDAFKAYMKDWMNRALAKGETATVDEFLDNTLAAAANAVPPSEIVTAFRIAKLFAAEARRLGLTASDALPVSALVGLTE
jgi:hypothetical protein